METDEFQTALDWLVDVAREKPTAVMCAESLWWRCHRRMVSDALVVRGCAVLHLLPGGNQQPHVLHPAARIEGRHLVYDQPTARRATEPQALGTARARPRKLGPAAP